MTPAVADQRASFLSDSMLISRFEHFGKQALYYRNRVIGLLPEVARRKLYLQRGCLSVYEYAKKVAGLSEEQVSRVLNVFASFDDKPILRGLLESGEVSVNKLSRVASIATQENQYDLANKVRVMSVGTLKTLVRDIRSEIRQESCEAEFVDVHKPERGSLFAQESLVAAMRDVSLPVDIADTIAELRRKGIDVESMMREMFAKREEKIVQEKDAVAKSLPEQSGRHVPKRVKDIVMQEYGKKCAVKTCGQLSEQLHHMARYGVMKSHDPHFLAPLCREHHQIAHAMDVRAVECGMGVRKIE